MPTEGTYVVRWHSVPGKIYTVYQSTNLLNGFTVLQSGIAATAPTNSLTTTSTGGQAYYMIGTGE